MNKNIHNSCIKTISLLECDWDSKLNAELYLKGDKECLPLLGKSMLTCIYNVHLTNCFSLKIYKTT